MNLNVVLLLIFCSAQKVELKINLDVVGRTPRSQRIVNAIVLLQKCFSATNLLEQLI